MKSIPLNILSDILIGLKDGLSGRDPNITGQPL